MTAQFEHFTAQSLSAAAGADPWKLNAEIQAGDAAAIDDLADAFHQSGFHVKEADDEFNAAKKQFEDAYRRDGGEHPINESAVVQEATAALDGHKDELSRIAVDLEQLAAALAVAQRDSDAELAALETQLHAIDAQISAEGPQAPWLMPGLHSAAVDATKATAEQLLQTRGAYVAQLDSATTAMMASGYVPEALDGADGIPGNSAQEEAAQYDRSGQRAADQAVVDKARAEKGSGTMGWTREEQAAAQRVQDYRNITDPANGTSRRGDQFDRAETARLSGERLGDWNMANSTGPVAKDPVLGGDARTRAQARLDLQEKLETGNASQGRWQPMTPDEATRRMDQWEVGTRETALTRLQEQLQQVGMTPDGAAAATDQLSQGIVPKELVDAAAAAGKPISGGEHAFTKWGEILEQQSYRPEVPFTATDIEALKKIGGHLGAAGTVVDLGVGIYEWQHGAPLGEVASKTAGGMAGAWALGSLGAEGGLAVAGPPGAFVGGLIFGTAGAFGGEEAGKRAYQWLTGN